MLRLSLFACGALVFFAGCNQPTPSHPQESSAPATRSGSREAHRSRREVAAAPGQFDYYLFTLSWSPEFCYSHRNSPECVAHAPKGFVVHGLWPENRDGTYPEHCTDAPGPADPGAMTDIMPDAKLVEHEWATHGTCSGLSAEEYFAQIRAAYEATIIPAPLRNLTQAVQLTPADLKNEFVQSNAGLQGDGLRIGCGHGRNYLVQVQVCLSKSLHPVACPAVQDCAAGLVTVAASR